MKKIVLMLILIAVVTFFASADIYVKSKSHTDPMTMMGQTTPAKDEVTEQWFSDSALAHVGKDQSFIVDMKRNVMDIVNHGSKTYVETTLPMDFAKLLPPQAAAMAGMMKMSATVKPGTEKKKIGSWNCSLYDVNMSVMGMSMPMKVWASTEVPFDSAKFAALFTTMMKGQMRMDDASVAEFLKIKGFQIATEMNAEIMGAKIHSTTEVLEIVQKPAPAGIYSAPKGYAKKDTLSMDELQKH
jgi:hypothetical protein